MCLTGQVIPAGYEFPPKLSLPGLGSCPKQKAINAAQHKYMAIQTAEKRSAISPNDSSIVHTEETPVQFDSIPTYGATLRHSCYPEFHAAELVYEALDLYSHRHRDKILQGCRSAAWFVRHFETGEVKVASSSCKLRWCPVCARARRAYIAHEIAEWLEDCDHPKFLTLTLKHTSAPLDHQVTHLYKFFRELRRRKEFAKAVTGGVWFFHIKKSKDDGLWHPHLHCLITGLYIPKRLLRNLWIQVTYGSEVIGIRAVHEYDKASSESARYAACPGSLAGLALEDATEMVEAMHGRRICGTWGTGRAVSLRPRPIEDRHMWYSVGRWQAVTADYKTNHNASAILHAWKTNQSLPEGIEYYPEDKFETDWAKYDWPIDSLESPADVERSPP